MKKIETNAYLSPREENTTASKILAAVGNSQFLSPNFEICINTEKGKKTAVKKSSGLRSLDQSSSKINTVNKHNNHRNYVPSANTAYADLQRKSH